MFFQELEASCGLDPDNASHLWLLHQLFKHSLNDDALVWAEAWNAHTMDIRGERDRSPKDMFFFGMIQKGWRDLSLNFDSIDESVDSLAEYGVDWEELDDPALLSFHNGRSEGERDIPDNVDDVVAGSRAPPNLSLVELTNQECPLSQDHLDVFFSQVQLLPGFGSERMDERRLLWQHALQLLVSLL